MNLFRPLAAGAVALGALATAASAPAAVVKVSAPPGKPVETRVPLGIALLPLAA